MVETENKSEHKPPLMEHTSPFRNTPDKFSSVLQIVLFAILHNC